MSKEDLNKEKLLAEIEHLKALTESFKIQNAPQNPSFISGLKKWNGAILSVISVLVAIWGLLIPAKSYIDEQKSLLKYDLNNQMVELLVGLDSTSNVADRSILLLSYYEKNSLPILIYKLERVNYFNNENLVNNIINVIDNINATSPDEVEEIITRRINIHVSNLEIVNQPDQFKVIALYNLVLIVQQMARQGHDISEYDSLLSETKKKLVKLEAHQELLESVLDLIDEAIVDMKKVG